MIEFIAIIEKLCYFAYHIQDSGSGGSINGIYISPTPELEEMVKAQVKTGRYNSSSEVDKRSIVWQNEEKYRKELGALQARLAVGEERLNRGEGVVVKNCQRTDLGVRKAS